MKVHSRIAHVGFTLLLAATGACAEPIDFARLMKQLASAPESRVEYQEKKFSSLLATPVESRGSLSYKRPDTVEKDVVAPRAERYRIEGNTLSVTRDGKERRIPLSSQPLLAAFAASLRGVLSGDERLLREHFRLAVSGTDADWRLEMTPIDEEVGRQVARVDVAGRGPRIATIEVREAGGDRSLLQVR